MLTNLTNRCHDIRFLILSNLYKRLKRKKLDVILFKKVYKLLSLRFMFLKKYVKEGRYSNNLCQEKQKQLISIVFTIIKSFTPINLYAVLGSVAKRRSHCLSDIDLIIVVPSKKEKHIVSKVLSLLKREVELGLSIGEEVYEYSEFVRKTLNVDPEILDLIFYGIIIYVDSQVEKQLKNIKLLIDRCLDLHSVHVVLRGLHFL